MRRSSPKAQTLVPSNDIENPDDFDFDTIDFQGGLSSPSPARSRRRSSSQARIAEGLVLPYQANRKCTDVTWVVFYLIIAIACHVRIVWTSFVQIESWERLIGFRDFRGDLCDADGKTATDDRFLYFCMTEDHHLNVTAPICLTDCPTSNNTIVSGCTMELQGYSTYEYWEQVCRPVYESGLEVEILPWLWAARTRSLFRIVTVNHYLFETVLVLMIVLSYFSYWFLYINGRLLVKAGMALATIVPIIWGLWMGGILEKIPGVPDKPRGVGYISDYIQAVFLCVVGMTFGGVLCSRRHLIDRVVDCLEMAFECICQSRLLLHPLIVVVFYAICGLSIALALALWTASVRRDELSLSQVSLFWGLVVVWAWTSQIVFTASELTLNLVVLTWCVKGGLKTGKATITNSELSRAYWIPFRYHFGTCVLGGLAIGIVRPFDLTIGKAFRFLRSKYNIFGGVIEYFGGGIMESYRKNIGLLKKQAFLEVAMKGRPFNEAAQRTQEVEEEQTEVMRILNGATWIIQFCCIVVNMGVAAWIATFALCNTDGKKAQTRKEQAAIVIVACIVALVVTLPFVLMFDTVSDALLFAHDVDEQFCRREKVNSMLQPKPCTVCMGRQSIAEFFESWGIVWPGYRAHKNLRRDAFGNFVEDEEDEEDEEEEDGTASEVDSILSADDYLCRKGNGQSPRSQQEGISRKGWR